MLKILKFGFIGAGKVGCTIGQLLNENSFHISGYYSKSPSSSLFASKITNSNQFLSLQELTNNSDVIFITVPDENILPVWNSLKNYDISKKTICHCSGSLSSEIFLEYNDFDVNVCSLHPLYPINDKINSYKNITNAFFTLEGTDFSCKFFSEILNKLNIKYKVINEKQKVLYHASAVMSSNLLTALYDSAFNLLSQCDFSEKESNSILTSLMNQNIENISSYGIRHSLTGPIERNDSSIVKKHLEILTNNDFDIYKVLSRRLLTLVKEEHRDRNHSEIEELLK
ncbi:MAG: Rossmann-like and DUF2520 domain-containing protein [Synergistaceae bacterium]